MIVPDAGIADQGGSNGHDVCALRCIERSQAMPKIQRIAPCLWFDDQAEQAAGAERQNAELLFPRFASLAENLRPGASGRGRWNTVSADTSEPSKYSIRVRRGLCGA